MNQPSRGSKSKDSCKVLERSLVLDSESGGSGGRVRVS